MSVKSVAAILWWVPMLALGCATPQTLHPQPGPVKTANGVEVQLKLEGEAMAIDITNRSREPLSVVPAAIRLHKDNASFLVENAPLWRQIPAGYHLPLRLRFALEGDRLSEAKDGAEVLLNTALSQGGRRLDIAAIKLSREVLGAAARASEGFHVSLLGGFGYNRFYSTSIYGGFGELRLGGQSEAVEYTARIRIQAGQTEGGQRIIKEIFGFGILVRVHPRVRLGFEMSSAPPLSWLIALRNTIPGEHVSSLIFETGPELRIDLTPGKRHALFVSVRPGLTLALDDYPPFVSPNILVGVGYGYTDLR